MRGVLKRARRNGSRSGDRSGVATDPNPLLMSRTFSAPGTVRIAFLSRLHVVFVRNIHNYTALGRAGLVYSRDDMIAVQAT